MPITAIILHRDPTANEICPEHSSFPGSVIYGTCMGAEHWDAGSCGIHFTLVSICWVKSLWFIRALAKSFAYWGWWTVEKLVWPSRERSGRSVDTGEEYNPCILILYYVFLLYNALGIGLCNPCSHNFKPKWVEKTHPPINIICIHLMITGSPQNMFTFG